MSKTAISGNDGLVNQHAEITGYTQGKCRENWSPSHTTQRIHFISKKTNIKYKT
jgi:hypothetical protein